MLAGAALLPFAGTASATILTSPVYAGPIKAESEGTTSIHNSSLGVSVSCGKSTFEGEVETFGASIPVSAALSSLTFSECEASHVTIKKPGTIEIHATSGGDGTVTWTGAELTITATAGGISCTYTTSSTDIGTLTGSETPEGEATIDINAATIPRTGDSIFCGSKGEWTASYKIITPPSLLVD